MSDPKHFTYKPAHFRAGDWQYAPIGGVVGVYDKHGVVKGGRIVKVDEKEGTITIEVDRK